MTYSLIIHEEEQDQAKVYLVLTYYLEERPELKDALESLDGKYDGYGYSEETAKSIFAKYFYGLPYYDEDMNNTEYLEECKAAFIEFDKFRLTKQIHRLTYENQNINAIYRILA